MFFPLVPIYTIPGFTPVVLLHRDYKIVFIKPQIMKRKFLYHFTALAAVVNIKKTVLAAAIIMLSLPALASPGEALIRLFSRTFPDAQYIRWTEDREYYAVSFVQNDTQCRIWYDKDGTVVHSLRYCREAELPMAVLLAVKKKHHDRRIDGVIEITNREVVTYELIMSDKNKVYAVAVNAYGEISPKYSFRKQE
jgi:hypothetical protein